MGIGYRIKEAREIQGLTQTELGKLVGVTGSAITNYENETSHPKEAIMYKLFDALQVDANYLFQDEMGSNYPMKVSYSEMEHIKKYRSLDSHGKEMVDFTLLKEWERSTAEKTNVVPLYIKEDTPDYLKPKAAHNDDESEEELSLMKEDVSSLKKPQL